ncbi:MAG TPA: flagellar basal body P-ring protein FlgI [bacterium]|nr:flagellar basal body P-ring protein FlgI [bacterium]
MPDPIGFHPLRSMRINIFRRWTGVWMTGVGLLILTGSSIAPAQPVISRVKDIAQLDGIQDNPLIGYGLVGGLAGTGDGRRGFTAQTLTNLLASMGINVLQPDVITTEVIPDNVAAVMVLANLPPYARPGTRINCTVVSIGRASSLQGGTLLPTPLKGADNQFHGLAYGSLSIGGFAAAAGGGGGLGAGSASVQKNHPAVGIIPNGVVVEGEPVFHNVVQEGNTLRWLLHTPDFKTASNLQRKINTLAGMNIARAEDASAVRVAVRMDANGNILLGTQPFHSLVDAIAFIDEAEIETDEPAKIVINERTGTVVAGQHIRVRDAVIAHGPLRITIETVPEVTPAGWGMGGAPVTTQQAQVTVTEGDKVTTVQGTTIGEVLSNLNALGYTPRDLIAILQNMAAAGAIKAQIEMIQ